MSRISLLLCECEEKLRLSVNNKNILRVQVGFNWLLSHLLMCPLICKVLNGLNYLMAQTIKHVHGTSYKYLSMVWVIHTYVRYHPFKLASVG